MTPQSKKQELSSSMPANIIARRSNENNDQKGVVSPEPKPKIAEIVEKSPNDQCAIVKAEEDYQLLIKGDIGKIGVAIATGRHTERRKKESISPKKTVTRSDYKAGKIKYPSLKKADAGIDVMSNGVKSEGLSAQTQPLVRDFGNYVPSQLNTNKALSAITINSVDKESRAVSVMTNRGPKKYDMAASAKTLTVQS